MSFIFMLIRNITYVSTFEQYKAIDIPSLTWIVWNVNISHCLEPKQTQETETPSSFMCPHWLGRSFIGHVYKQARSLSKKGKQLQF